MIDIHCHMLPSIDDGATDIETALCMAQMAVDDGITKTVCTPHIYPGVFENTKQIIHNAVEDFKKELLEADIPLELAFAADTHMAPDLIEGIRSDRIPTINGSRYLLFEPPHNIAPPRFEEFVFSLMAQDIIPVITHPERLKWINTHYDVFINVARRGAWLQITGGAVTGKFGKKVRYWAERMLDERVVHVLATDAHNIRHRPPILSEACAAAERFMSPEEVKLMVYDRPLATVMDTPPGKLPTPEGLLAENSQKKTKKSFMKRIFG